MDRQFLKNGAILSKDVLLQIETEMYRGFIQSHTALNNLSIHTIRFIKYHHTILTNTILHRKGQDITGL